MQRCRTLTDGRRRVRLELTSTSTSPLAIDDEETAETRIRRLITENPVIIFSRPSCCMCHVMKRLLSSFSVHPTVIELDDNDEISALPPPSSSDGAASSMPSLFIGGNRVGGLESLMALHLSSQLVPKLVEAGVLRNPAY
ncbi:glutaredoxin-C6-like [Impatiens glandulifera]|uniref:glutaredoxin-C6-like n=1 Tax=Impatiens glandulifera TaxID=253017 RepID=UPI001FB0C609|nr:glutaredoxin-C6-like [Impatiens glandulifera]